MDVFRFILIYRLAVVHVFVLATPSQELDVIGLPYYFDSIVGGVIGAPRFMIMMGIGLSFNRHASPRELVRRAVKLAIIGLVLNVFRFLLPNLIGYALTGDTARYLDELPYLFFGNDILQFAALAMMLMALFLSLKLTAQKIFLCSIAISIAGTLLRGVDLHSNVLNVICGHFIGIENTAPSPYIYSNFPLLIWFIFYAFGYMFGYYYQRLKNKSAFYKTVSPICLVIGLAACLWEIFGGFGMMMGEGDNVFYHMSTPEAFVCIISCIGLLIIPYYLSKVIPEKWKAPIIRVSRSVTIVYCIHWVLVYWSIYLGLVLLKGDPYLAPIPALMLGIFLSIVSILLAQGWTQFKTFVKRKKAYETKR